MGRAGECAPTPNPDPDVGFLASLSGLASPVKEIWAGRRCPLPFRIVIPFVNSFHQVLSISLCVSCCRTVDLLLCSVRMLRAVFGEFAGRTPCSGPA